MIQIQLPHYIFYENFKLVPKWDNIGRHTLFFDEQLDQFKLVIVRHPTSPQTIFTLNDIHISSDIYPYCFMLKHKCNTNLLKLIL